MSDVINHPPHYTQGAIEPIDVIEDWKLGFHLGNTLKYLARAAHKGSEIQDLRKAAWYLRRQIEQLEKQQVKSVRADPGSDPDLNATQLPYHQRVPKPVEFGPLLKWYRLRAGFGIREFSETVGKDLTASEWLDVEHDRADDWVMDRLVKNWNGAMSLLKLTHDENSAFWSLFQQYRRRPAGAVQA